MDKLCCAGCSCQEKCQCMQTTVKTQIILYLRQKQKRTQMKRQLASKPKYINIKPSMCKQDNMKQTHINKLEKSSSKISRGSVDLRQTKNQFNNSSSGFSRNTQNWNPNTSHGYHKTSYKTPKTQLKNHSMIITPNLSETLQLRLIDQDNQNLKRQLTRLKREQKQLMTVQKQMQNKLSYEIRYLSANSEEIKQRSIQRKKEIKELQQMLQWKRQSKAHSQMLQSTK